MTLIELMVACAVVAILASVAYPSYQSYVRKSHRPEGLTLLQAAQLAQEKYRLNHDTYASDLTDAVAFDKVCANATPANCLSSAGRYKLVVTGTSTASNYTLTATAQGDQAKDTTCASMQIAQTATALSYLPAACWNR